MHWARARRWWPGGAALMGGTFFQPTVLTGVSRRWLSRAKRHSGLMHHCSRFKTEQEAIDMANDTEYGLVPAFYKAAIWHGLAGGGGAEYGMKRHGVILNRNCNLWRVKSRSGQ